MKLSNTYTDQQWKLLVTKLKDIATAKGITQQQIAEATGLHQSSVARVFSLKYCPTLDMYLKIAGAIGVGDGSVYLAFLRIDYGGIFESSMKLFKTQSSADKYILELKKKNGNDGVTYDIVELGLL